MKRILAVLGVILAVGCSKHTAIVRVEPPKNDFTQARDTDGDGIPDPADACPHDPEDNDQFEDEDGCPDPDNDKDGIPDVDDNCPNEPELPNGFEDGDGCHDDPPKVVIIKPPHHPPSIDAITFSAGSAALQPHHAPLIDAVAKVLEEHPEVRLVEVEGHADDPGGERANLALSQKRAEAVRDALIRRGIKAERLTAKGYGRTRPMLSPEGLRGATLKHARSVNRRAQYKILDRD